MGDHLAPSGAVDADLRAALPLASPTLTVRVVEGLNVLALRHLAGGASAVEAALADHNLTPLPAPGTCHGSDPCLLWTGPAEFLLLTSQRARAQRVLQSLAPGREPLACALDQSPGCLTLELKGPGIDDVLPRILDASATPRQVGKAQRTRLIDIGTVAMRKDRDCIWLIVDRSHGLYAAKWITYALQAEAGRI
jgi:heterotetrameric sarcosine oxidase gamma subunit